MHASSAKHNFPDAIVNTINGQAFTIELLLGDFVSIGSNFNTFISSADEVAANATVDGVAAN